jgi:hypothetical protein
MWQGRAIVMPVLRLVKKRAWILLTSKSEQHQQIHDLTHLQDIQKKLQQSVQALN